MNLDNAIAYDIETYPNCFTFSMEMLKNGHKAVWEISHFRDDRRELMQFFQWLAATQTVMISFNGINFDYPVIHALFNNPQMTVEQIYDKAMSIINSFDKFGHTIWADNRFAPQLDLFKLHHMDNKAKSTSLKALQINMRSPSVVDMPVPVGTILTKEQIDHVLIPYNNHDVQETKRFAEYSMEAINFRLGLVEQFGVDVLNWNDTKIGEQMVIRRLGDELCYDRSSGRRKTRQTARWSIALNDIIFPYVQFHHPEFNRVLAYLRQQVLQPDELKTFGGDEAPQLKTKGVFTDLKAHVGGIDFYFGVGGIHGSVSSQRVQATDEWLIRDIDVAALYPSIAIVNNLAPAHLGQAFVQVYSELPKERKKWQLEKGKKCVEANALKLASNGVYGKSNSVYSPFYDPQFMLTITVNGQLLLCMLAERLLSVPTLKILQINTDGISYYIHRDYEPLAKQICKEWEALTKLTLEDVNYKRMFIRDVNSYVAEAMDGSFKLKGAYWTPDPLDWHGSIAASQPASWHKNLSNPVSIRAAVAYMVHGVDIETFIRMTTNPHDFVCAVKVKKADQLLWGGEEIQRTTRYYISTDGNALIKRSPPKGKPGAYKQANGVSDAEYHRVMQETGGAWDPRVCTKNKSQYEEGETAVVAGYNVTVVNDIKDFCFDNINYDWYISEARKLIID